MKKITLLILIVFIAQIVTAQNLDSGMRHMIIQPLKARDVPSGYALCGKYFAVSTDPKGPKNFFFKFWEPSPIVRETFGIAYYPCDLVVIEPITRTGKPMLSRELGSNAKVRGTLFINENEKETLSCLCSKNTAQRTSR